MSAAGDGASAAEATFLRTCRTASGKGVVQLRKAVEAAPPGSPLVRQITLNDAVKSDNLSSLRYLVDELEVETLNVKTIGYTPLQIAIIWGKIDIMVYLLSRGADPMLRGESSVVDMARLRQQRLQEAFDNAGEGAEFEGFSITKGRIEPLIEEGLAILHVLEGVESYGCYQDWAENNGSHRLVKRFSKDIKPWEPRYQLAVLRAMVLAGKASPLPAAERAAIAAEEAALAAARAREEQSLQDALVEAGFSIDAAKEMRDAFRAPTLKALRALRLAPEVVEGQLEAPVRQRRITEGEKRKFARFVRELDEEPAPAAAPAAGAAAAAGGAAAAQGKAAAVKGSAKSKAKSQAPAAKAALLALAAKGAKGAGRGAAAAKDGPPKTSVAKKASGPVDSFDLMFREALPDGAFMLITRFWLGI